VLTTSRQPAPTPEPRSLTGWGRRPSTTSDVISPGDVSSVVEVASNASPHIPRGLGRSYGDAAQLAGGVVVDMTSIKGLQVDEDAGTVTAFAGTSLGEILDVIVPKGWFLPVVPGTRHVTVGGAIAADVHGKNHHRDGALSAHVETFNLVTGDGRIVKATPGSEPFAATVGGMGLTGMITEATFRLIPIETGAMSTHTTWALNLPGVMEDLLEADVRHQYSVAWLDLSPGGRGRGLVTGADHASKDEAAGFPTRKSAGSRRLTMTVPTWNPAVVNALTVGVFNRLWNELGRRRAGTRIESLDSFFFPLDRIGEWNRLYGKKGFLQYQFVVPLDREDVLMDVTKTLVSMDTPVSLAVLKRMGVRSSGYLSFPAPGWTLAVDMPLGDPSLRQTLDECDLEIAAAGGRVYLAKDSRLRRGLVDEMYPEIPLWREAQARLDPGRRLRSNLSERLGLTT
jgi:decaprenylphospho-beta-D-ribofuranose 2-oxidase